MNWTAIMFLKRVLNIYWLLTGREKLKEWMNFLKILIQYYKICFNWGKVIIGLFDQLSGSSGDTSTDD